MSSDETGLTKMFTPSAQGLAPRLRSDDDGQQLPAIAIAQPAHPKKPDDLKAGQFFLPLTGEGIGERIMIVAVAQFFSRAYWRKQEQGKSPDAEPICSSIDGIYPMKGESPPQLVGGAVVDDCERCLFKEWGGIRMAPRGSPPPACSHVINYVVIARGSDGLDHVGRMTFKRSSYTAGHDIEQAIRSTIPNPPLWSKVFELRLVEVVKPQQRYFVPKMRVIGQTSVKAEPLLRAAEEIFSKWSPVKAARVAREAHEEEVEERGGGDVVDASTASPKVKTGPAKDDDLPFGLLLTAGLTALGTGMAALGATGSMLI